jgi:hypothetical protein
MCEIETGICCDTPIMWGTIYNHNENTHLFDHTYWTLYRRSSILIPWLWDPYTNGTWLHLSHLSINNCD